MPAQKRSIDEADPSTPAAKPSKRNRRKPRPAQGRKDKDKGKDKAPATPSAAAQDDDLEEGEVVEGDFSDLFMVDTTPAAVAPKNRFVDVAPAAPSPLSKPMLGDDADLEADEADLSPLPVSGREGHDAQDADGEDDGDDRANTTLDEDEAMQLFAKEVALTDDEDEGDSDEESSDEVEGFKTEGLMLYDDEEGLKEAIQGRIVDDSSAPVAGRYYKEADLTKTCVLCGEHGHSSRDCTHQQCFICGSIDDHEARSCPVSLVCSACGSRGHFARDCDVAPGSRGGYGQRCGLCQSNNHMSANCPSLWRVYDTSGPKPPKRKPVLACANCGSSRDHFIDDCLLPRGHPMKYADPSAFNRAALGNSSSLPSYSAAPSASRRRGAPAASEKRRDWDDDPADDDWFASRSRGGSGGNKGGRGQPPPKQSGRGVGGGWGSSGGGGGGGAGSGRKGQHIHFGGFSERTHDRFHESSRDRDYSRGSGYDSPRDDWRSMYGSGDGGRGGGGGRDGGRRGGGGGGGGSKPPSLLDRMDSGGGGHKGQRRPGPSYRGGYM
ncbi:hypothetical protein JCM10207_007576 [Rhodosporidiobolus poonsookiae]